MVGFKHTKMGLKSKEENILKLFFNESAKHWHFTEIVKEAKISKKQANLWLKKLMKESIIIHVKPLGKMPYFKANFDHSNYQDKKKLYSLNIFYQSGLLNHLRQLSKAKTVIIFGSFARYDWHSKSDIDLFIYGDSKGLDTTTYKGKLKRDISAFTYPSLKEMRDIRSGLMKNIINGYVVKGNINDIIGAIV